MIADQARYDRVHTLSTEVEIKRRGAHQYSTPKRRQMLGCTMYTSARNTLVITACDWRLDVAVHSRDVP